MPAAPRERLPESEVTPPSDWQPHPGRWHSTDDESTELEVTELVAALVRAIQPDMVLETGTAFGQTTRAIAEALVRNGQGRLWTVDLDVARQHAVSLSTLGDGMRPVPITDVVTFINGHSEEWEPPADVCFAFAFHDCDMRRRAEVFRHFRPWYRPGTIVAFHDMAPSFNVGPHAYGAGEPSILPLVDEGLIRIITLRTPRGITIAEVL